VKHLLTGLFITAGAVVLGVGVLAAVEVLPSPPNDARRRRQKPDEIPAVPASKELGAAVQPTSAPPAKSKRNFSIKRTKSEVGFVYWILEGYGPYKCFVLCDSWDEAVARAKTKLEQVNGGGVEALMNTAP
jgi:hypothetical protein